MLGYLTGLVHISWVTTDDVVWRYVINDSRPRTNDGTMTNSHSSLDDTAVTNMNVLANVDLSSNFGAVATFQSVRISRCF